MPPMVSIAVMIVSLGGAVQLAVVCVLNARKAHSRIQQYQLVISVNLVNLLQTLVQLIAAFVKQVSECPMKDLLTVRIAL